MRELMDELSRTAPADGTYRVYLVGGATAVVEGWRAATIDADLHADRQDVFRGVPAIRERLGLNIELARPEKFVPPIAGSADRHVFIERVGDVEFFHYDPYAQLFSKIVRGFRKDLLDAERFVRGGMVDPGRLRQLLRAIPDSAYAMHPNLDREAVENAVEDFFASLE
ncbi:MAG: DUF6036 family nucleotidyltransferase [Gemmatimonadota bacterium]